MTPSDLLERIRAAAPDHEAVAAGVQRLARLSLDRASEEEKGPALLSLGRNLARIEAAADFCARASMRLFRVGPKPVSFGLSLDEVARAWAFGEVPSVLPRAAIQELIERIPSLARSAALVRAAYNDRHAFALAKAADLTITERVKAVLRSSMARGLGERASTKIVADLGGWSESYAEVVVRTNATTAFSAGRFREAQLLKREGLVAALRYDAMPDSRTRSNHAAADGLVADVDDDVWNRLSPPLGYNCRCVLSPVDAIDVPRGLFRADGTLKRARAPASAFADKDSRGIDLGFGRRPDTLHFLAGYSR